MPSGHREKSTITDVDALPLPTGAVSWKAALRVSPDAWLEAVSVPRTSPRPSEFANPTVTLKLQAKDRPGRRFAAGQAPGSRLVTATLATENGGLGAAVGGAGVDVDVTITIGGAAADGELPGLACPRGDGPLDDTAVGFGGMAVPARPGSARPCARPGSSGAGSAGRMTT